MSARVRLLPGDCSAVVEQDEGDLELNRLVVIPGADRTIIISQRHAFEERTESITVDRDGLLGIIAAVLKLDEAERMMK